MTEDELRQYCQDLESDFDSTFTEQENGNERLLLFLSLLTGVTAMGTVWDGLTPTEQETLIERAAKEYSQYPNKVKEDLSDLLEKTPLDDTKQLPPEAAPNLITEEELERYRQLMEETKQYSRMQDPRTVENKAWQQQEEINDKTGMFNYLESLKNGNLDGYIEYQNIGGQILIPWVTQGDSSVCEDCQDLEDSGPYPPDEYPEPPHFGCRCNDPFPDPIIAAPGEVQGEEYAPTPDEIDAAYQYNIDDNPLVNDYLRTGEVPEDYFGIKTEEEMKEELDKQIENLENLINNNKLEEDTTVYRGVPPIYDDKVIGDTIDDLAFQSTTTEPYTATEFGNNILEIQLPEGYNGLDLDQFLSDQLVNGNLDLTPSQIHPHLNENEILLQHGNSFEIIGQYVKDGGEWDMFLEGDKFNIIVVKPI